VKLFSSKRRIVVAAALILLALFLLRPGASRLKSRLIFSISSALGRPVDIGSVHLRLLPWPGFDLQNLVVYEDPAFGAEPMLRAGEVTATLRLTSLLRGRLEISRLDLTEPSLNLVRADSGRWNLETLLERTAHTPLAPTGKAKSEARLGFPYIEASSARINFKSGPEKKPYALTNADFSLWQDSENSWGVRLKAQPFRTDLNLNDMGLLRVNGTWQRADAVRNAPLHLSFEWSRAQLGQFTKFFSRKDLGWRGEILIDVTLAGTPAQLQISSNASIDDFRRYDIASGNRLRLAAHCEGEYTSFDYAFRALQCNAPVGSGLITLKGTMGLPGSHNYALSLTAENVPASAAVVLAQRAKSNLPDDLVAGGTVRANLRIDEKPGAAPEVRFTGHGEIANLDLASAADKAEIEAETVPFLLAAGDSAGTAAHRQAIRKTTRVPEGLRLEFGPFPVAVGRMAPATAQGWINRSGYDISLAGEAEIAKALRVARMVGLPALQSATTEGTAQVDLQIAGLWAGSGNGTASAFSAPQVTGTAELRNVRIAFRGVGGPIEIVSADTQLLPEEVRIAKLNAMAAGTSWTGSLTMPRGCGTPSACQVHFLLAADQIALADLSAWVHPSGEERPWYRVLESNATTAHPSFLANVRASGQLTADHLQVQSLDATGISAKVNLDSGKLQITELTADFLGGKHRGEWQADFSVKPGLCKGSGSLTATSLTDLADAMKDGWISGIANATYELNVPCASEVRTSFWTLADGALQFDMRDGTLPHVSLAGDGEPIRVTRLVGQARLYAGKIEMKDARLESPGGNFQLSGIATVKGEVDFKLATRTNSPASGYAIRGTVAEPRVIRLDSPETQAKLKP